MYRRESHITHWRIGTLVRVALGAMALAAVSTAAAQASNDSASTAGAAVRGSPRIGGQSEAAPAARSDAERRAIAAMVGRAAMVDRAAQQESSQRAASAAAQGAGGVNPFAGFFEEPSGPSASMHQAMAIVQQAKAREEMREFARAERKERERDRQLERDKLAHESREREADRAFAARESQADREAATLARREGSAFEERMAGLVRAHELEVMARNARIDAARRAQEACIKRNQSLVDAELEAERDKRRQEHERNMLRLSNSPFFK